MKEIAFVITSTGWGGLEINVLRLAGWLGERNWKIRLYTTKESRIFQEAQIKQIHVSEIRDHRKYFDYTAAFRFSRILKRDNVKTVMIFDNKDIGFIFLTKMMMAGKLKVIYQQHMQIGVKKNDIFHTIRFSAINAWLSPLDSLKKETEEKTNMDARKIHVIPLGIETGRFIQRMYSKEEARKKFGISDNSIVIGIAGRIDPKKGQLFLVQAIEKLQSRYKDLVLLIVGSPTLNDPAGEAYYLQINEYVSSHNLTKKIIFAGHTEDIQLFYNAIDIFALGTEGETYGMVTIEAMASGLPIIATNSGGTPEILDFGKLGYLYNPGDLYDFCTKLEEMLQNPELTSNMAADARTSALERFSHLREVEMIEKLLQ